MDRFWKWLMRTDARSIFVVSLLLFIGVAGWRVWVALNPPPEPVAAQPAPAAPVKLSAFKPLDVINLVSNQFRAQALVVPVNPFRPTFEAMVRNPASGDLEAVVSGAASGGGEGSPPVQADGPSQGGDRRGGRRGPGQRGKAADPAGTAPAATPGGGTPPTPKFAFRGMLQRPDGQVAAWVSGTAGGSGFIAAGDTFHGFSVVGATAERVTLRKADGTERVLERGAPPAALESE